MGVLRAGVVDLKDKVTIMAKNVIVLGGRRDDLENDLRMSSERITSGEQRENALMAELIAFKRELSKKRLEIANMRWAHNKSVAKVRRAKVDIEGALQAVAKSAKSAHSGVSDKVQAELQQTWKRMTAQLDMESVWAIANFRETILRDRTEIVHSLAGVMRSWQLVCCSMRSQMRSCA